MRWLALAGPTLLGLPSVLKGLNIVNDAESISLTIKDNMGGQMVIKPKLNPLKFNGFPKLPALTNLVQPTQNNSRFKQLKNSLFDGNLSDFFHNPYYPLTFLSVFFTCTNY